MELRRTASSSSSASSSRPPASSSRTPASPTQLKTPKSVRFASGSKRGSTSGRGSPLEERNLFSIDGDIDEDPYGDPHSPSAAAPSSSSSSSGPRPYGLKSTIGSREAEFDAASDTYSDEEDLLEAAQSARSMLGAPSSGGGRRDRTMPLPLPPALRQSMDGLGGNIAEFRRNVMQGLEEVGEATGLTENGELPDWLKRGAGVFAATTNMANSILGAGIVGLPYSMKQSGFVAGVILLVGLAMLTDWTIRLIILNSKLSGRQTYIEIMEHCFGMHGKAAVSFFQFAFAFGGMCAFCVVIGDTIPHVLSSLFPALAPGASFWSFLASRSFVITFCTLTVSYPLSLYRSIENLSKASAVALVSMILIVGTVIVRGPAMPAELKGDPSLRFTFVQPSNLVSSISVISFAFVCHHNSLLIYASLKEPSMDKFSKVTHYSTAIACAALTAMSIAGYWTFEEKTLGNILNNFPENDTFVNIARFAFGVNMFTTFPLEAFVCREVLETYFFANQYSVRLHLIITTSLVVASLIVSLLTCDLGIVLELTGGLSATALAFIFPAVCFLKLTKEGEGKALKISLGNRSQSSRRGSGGGAESSGEGPGGSSWPSLNMFSSSSSNGGPRTKSNGSNYKPVSGDIDDDDEEDGVNEQHNAIDVDGPTYSSPHSSTPYDPAPSMSRSNSANPANDSTDRIPIADVHLPLRPGAPIEQRLRSSSGPLSPTNARGRSASSSSSTNPAEASPSAQSYATQQHAQTSLSGGDALPLTSTPLQPSRPWYDFGTKPLSVACACFGTVVLVISVGQALVGFLTGSAGGGRTC